MKILAITWLALAIAAVEKMEVRKTVVVGNAKYGITAGNKLYKCDDVMVLPKPILALTSHKATLFMLGQDFSVFAMKNGKLMWDHDSIKLPRFTEANIIVWQEHVFAPTKPNTIAALDYRSGKTIWQALMPYGAFCRFFTTKEHLVCISDKEYLILDKAFNAVKRQSCNIQGVIDSSTVYDSEKVFTLDNKILWKTEGPRISKAYKEGGKITILSGKNTYSI